MLDFLFLLSVILVNSYLFIARVYEENTTTEQLLVTEEKESTQQNNPIRFLNTISAVFLVLLAVSGNFVGETLNCRFQKVLSNNMFYKHLVLFVIIYFSISFSNQEKTNSPIQLFIRSFTIWSVYVLFTRTDVPYNFIIVILLFLLLLEKDYISYLKAIDIDFYEENLYLFVFGSQLLIYLLFSMLAIGFYQYYKRQKNEKKSDFQLLTFLLGSPKCESVNE